MVSHQGRCEGTHIRVWLDDQLIIDFKDDAGYHGSGKVGIGTFKTQAQFRSLKVTALDGTVLHEGLPSAFDIMADASAVRPVGEVKVEIEADDLGRLLVDWLSELLYLCDVDDALFSEFEVNISDNKLKGIARGENIDATRHGLKTDIKAVTYHMLEVNAEKNCVQVLFDI